MDENAKKKLYAALSAPFGEEAVERTDGKITGRGYSTTGLKYQFVVNRLNESLGGVGGFRAHRTVTVKEVTRSNGRPAFEAICDLTLELGSWSPEGKFVVFAEALADGGHIASSEADARKGSYTNAFKKAAAFFGVGRQAYEGTLDDDNVPGDEMPAAQAPRTNANVQSAPVAAMPQPQQTPPGYARTGQAVDTRPSHLEKSRLSSKQLAAIMSIGRKLGVEPSAIRSRVKTQFGCQLEFISREQASQVIKSLDTQLNGNGSGHAALDQGEGLAS
jgi:hypothetical protein